MGATGTLFLQRWLNRFLELARKYAKPTNCHVDANRVEGGIYRFARL